MTTPVTSNPTSAFQQVWNDPKTAPEMKETLKTTEAATEALKKQTEGLSKNAAQFRKPNVTKQSSSSGFFFIFAAVATVFAAIAAFSLKYKKFF